MSPIISNSNYSIEKLSVKYLRFILLLRNYHRKNFFYTKQIPFLKHLVWYARYLVDLHSQIYVITYFDKPYGTFGIKKITNTTCELYNVMRDFNTAKIPSLMRKSILETLSNKSLDKVICKVKVGNPALAFYQGLGFVEKKKFDQFKLLVLEMNKK